MQWNEYLGETVRVWDAQHSGVLVEGEVIGVTDRPTIIVRSVCECGRPKNVSRIAELPIDVMRWIPAHQAHPKENP